MFKRYFDSKLLSAYLETVETMKFQFKTAQTYNFLFNNFLAKGCKIPYLIFPYRNWIFENCPDDDFFAFRSRQTSVVSKILRRPHVSQNRTEIDFTFRLVSDKIDLLSNSLYNKKYLIFSDILISIYHSSSPMREVGKNSMNRLSLNYSKSKNC